MLTAAGCAARRQRLVEAADADLLIISNPRHIQYFCGLYITPLALSGWGQNFLLIDTRRNQTTLLVHNFIAGDAQKAHVDQVQVWRWYDAATASATNLHRDAVEELNRQIGLHQPRQVGIELGSLPFGAAVPRWLDIGDHILTLRRQKDPDELALIQKTVTAIAAGHRAAREVLAPGMSELELYHEIYAAIVQAVGQPVLPLGDYVSGTRTAAVGGPPTARQLQTGELVILDVFPIINGYRGDFTATLCVGGLLSGEQRRLEHGLHAGLEAGEDMLRPGVHAADVYAAVRGGLASYGLDKGFPHHAGHGLGLGHPEAPYLVPQSHEVLQAGDVIALEPGSYLESEGARIEHNYLITDDGFRRLTQHETHFAL